MKWLVKFDAQRFFTTHIWWGKIIGAVLGYLISRPAGAVFGILIGHFFDRGLADYFSRPHWPYHAEKRNLVQHIFFKTTFSVLGLLAKADGRVSEHDIQMAKTLMQELGLNHTQKKAAQQYFKEGKLPTFNLSQALTPLRKALHDNPELLKLFIDIQYRAAQIDGLSIKKQFVLNTILSDMGFSPLHKQYRFYEGFANYTNDQKYSSSTNQQQQQGSVRYGVLDHAYAILDVSPLTNKQDVKRAYRRLMSKNHPDKLIAKGFPEEMIKIANEKTQAISKAYQQICDSKGG